MSIVSHWSGQLSLTAAHSRANEPRNFCSGFAGGRPLPRPGVPVDPFAPLPLLFASASFFGRPRADGLASAPSPSEASLRGRPLFFADAEAVLGASVLDFDCAAMPFLGGRPLFLGWPFASSTTGLGVTGPPFFGGRPRFLGCPSAAVEAAALGIAEPPALGGRPRPRAGVAAASSAIAGAAAAGSKLLLQWAWGEAS